MNKYISKKCKGSAFIATVIFLAVISLLLASLLTWTTTERRFSYRHALWLEARNAAEATAEYGLYQISSICGTRNLIADGSTLFKTGDTFPLQLPDAAFFQGTNIYTATSGSNAPQILASAAVMKTNKSSATQFTYDDQVDNFKADGEVVTQTVYRRDINVYAKATAVPANGNPITSYIRETISIRGIPLFTSAIFYNMDMELHPGPTFNVGGPVKVNGNLYVDANQSGSSIDGSETGSTLNFKGPVNVAGSVFHSWKGYASSSHGGGAEVLNVAADVTFKDSQTGTQVSMLTSGTWKDSTLNNGTITGSSVINYNSYSESTPFLTQTKYNNALNAAVSSVNLLSTNNFKQVSEALWHDGLKTKAGGASPSALPFPDGVGQYTEQTSWGTDDSNNSGRLLIEPKDTSSSKNDEIESQKYAGKACITIKVNAATGIADADRISFVVGGTTTKVAGLDSSINTLATWSPYTKSGSNVTKGMYDHRRGLDVSTKGEVDLVEIDYGALRTAVNQIATTKTVPGLTPSNWNGIIYVEIVGGPTTRTADSGSDKAGSTIPATVGGATKVGVMIKNGKNSSGAGTPSYGTEEGLTIATNGPAYIWGDLNANGTVTASSLNAPDSSEEKPMAIAADAITVLSNGWSRATSASLNSPDASGPIEISAAFITGITPTNKGGNGYSSGGAHNIVRFLEKWNSTKTTNIRGSLVCLYESRVASERFDTSYYGAPGRNWGLNDNFKNGKFPPGTPMTISFRRINFTELSASAYASAISLL